MQVRQWCASSAATGLRIVLAGYENEHDALLERRWRKVAGKAGSGRGMNADPKAGHRERLWLSPECLHDDIFQDFDREGK